MAQKGSAGQHLNVFQYQIQKDNSHCLVRHQTKMLPGAEGHGGSVQIVF